jgi:hypothetical protein
MAANENNTHSHIIIVLYLFFSDRLNRTHVTINIKMNEMWLGMLTSFPRKGRKYTAKSPNILSRKANPISLTSICRLSKKMNDKTTIMADRVV